MLLPPLILAPIYPPFFMVQQIEPKQVVQSIKTTVSISVILVNLPVNVLTPRSDARFFLRLLLLLLFPWLLGLFVASCRIIFAVSSSNSVVGRGGEPFDLFVIGKPISICKEKHEKTYNFIVHHLQINIS